jgi:hypothetical protein
MLEYNDYEDLFNYEWASLYIFDGSDNFTFDGGE